ncbi:GerW family sporulation protein [Cohnella kolymensis]|uniref:GerW family sporulation protein n=1 Tax=Cohnella kolymensis TaxID=1590652 RepID=UPI0009E1C413|nr:GerW family sporulation protein [Cohnella kolymensis]
MFDHPINDLMQTAMENIKEMVDVNTIVGEPVQTPDGSVIMPISRVNFGFAAGGSDYNTSNETSIGGTRMEGATASVALPFGGGSGGGISITPIAFLVVGSQGVNVVPLDNQTHILERLIDAAPHWVDKIKSMFQGAAPAMNAGMTGMTPGMNQGMNQGINQGMNQGTQTQTQNTTTAGTNGNPNSSNNVM